MKSRYVNPRPQRAINGSIFASDNDFFIFIDRGPDYQLHESAKGFIEARKVQEDFVPNKYYFRLQPFPVLKEENHIVLKPVDLSDLFV